MHKTIFAITEDAEHSIDIQGEEWWTGKPPVYGMCPGVQQNGIIHSLPLVNTHGGRQELLNYFDNTWTLTEVLFTSLKKSEYIYARAYHKLRHPMIFYYVHPAALYVNKLRVAGILDAPLNPEIEALFETGVDEMRWDNLYEGEEDVWPSLEKAHAYRRQVYALVKNIIETHPALDTLPVTQKHPMWALVMGFEHERIHLETSSALLREIEEEYLKTPAAWPKAYPEKLSSAKTPQVGKDFPENALVPVAKSTVDLGKPADWPSFGWDNEYGRESRKVRPFQASRFLISNGEYHAFVKEGGYRTERYWSEDGWRWRRFRNIKWPSCWVQNGPSGSHEYRLRTLFNTIDMQWTWPVLVNFHEAKAYCAWRAEKEGKPFRLLTEGEHNAMRGSSIQNRKGGVERDMVMQRAEKENRPMPVNSNLAYGSEIPVDVLPANDKGFYDVFGNVWQWCEDHFHPLKGAKPHPFYDDFSAPCYDGQHQMILGGSFISTGDEASIWARFHFRPHFFQHAGFRIACSDDENPAHDAVYIGHTQHGEKYEQQETLNQYLLMHYADNAEIFDAAFADDVFFPPVLNLPEECTLLAKKYAPSHRRVLDLGCAVGGCSFRLTEYFDEVLGVDYSHAFVEVAETIKREGRLEYRRKESGDRYTQMTALLPEKTRPAHVSFEQGDACNLREDIGQVDAVVLANVICRLPDIDECFAHIQRVLRTGGVLVLTSPYSWFEEFSAKEQWITDNPLEVLAKRLPDFVLEAQQEIPFVIREHRRKFEYIITHATVWRKK